METPGKNQMPLKADDIIFEAIQPSSLKSFFLFAGAGSGKTRTLVNALRQFREKFGIDFRLQHRKIAVITYTKAASNVIRERIEFDPLFSISTIHSFCWELIQSYQIDIRDWRQLELQDEIVTLESQLATGRGGKTAEDRQTKLERAKQRLAQLPLIRKFVYNPNGDNRTRDSLNHSQVIKIATDFLKDKPLMRKILINKFPIIFIDEAQDTRKELINILFEIQAEYKTVFSLGLFGDTMQRIYLDGKASLGVDLPADWLTPAKTINYRCPKRIIRLLNKIRSAVDTHQQEPAPKQNEGFARLYIVNTTNKNEMETERQVCEKMAEITGDEEWRVPNKIKKLILEHHMAANRLGFSDLYEALNTPDTYRTGLLDGTLSSLQVFTKMVLPLIIAHKNGDSRELMRLVKHYSPLMDKEVLKNSDNQISILESVHEKVNSLTALWNGGKSPTIGAVAKRLKETGLFETPDVINNILSRKGTTLESGEDEILGESDRLVQETLAWETAFERPFEEMAQYQNYVSESSGFGTHQGVKGLEFPRVLVILDDEAARGNLFKYERLFGVEPLSATDIKNQRDGIETSIERTRRLLYVGCSRAENSLALVAYTSNPMTLSKTAVELDWFSEKEIGIIS